MESSVNKALRLLEASIGNISQHVYDDFVERNVKSAFDSGMKAVIIRRQMFKCCDYCAKLSGIYDYAQGDYPDDIFKRHANCRCLVSVKTEKTGGYQDVWSKKEYRTQKQARQARESELRGYEDNLQKYLRKKNIARANGEKYIDATEYWNSRQKEYPAEVINSKKVFEWDGITYGDKPEHRIKFDPSDNEKRVAELIREKFGGRIVLMPRVDFPQKVKVSDYLYNGIKIDLKTLEEWGEDSIFQISKKAKGQSKSVIIDISKFGEKQNMAIEQAKKLFVRRDTKFLEYVTVVNGNNFVAILEKIK